MELEIEGRTHALFEKPEPEISRLKTSLRLRYEAEARVLREQMGSLEKIRTDLSLSRRKMCQLLLVDPSTWTRWMKDETRIPPHIFKALQWYLALIEKYPVFHPHHQITVQGQGISPHSGHDLEGWTEERRVLEAKIQELESVLQARVSEISEQVGDKQQVGVAWKVLLMFNTIFILWMILRSLL